MNESELTTAKDYSVAIRSLFEEYEKTVILSTFGEVADNNKERNDSLLISYKNELEKHFKEAVGGKIENLRWDAGMSHYYEKKTGKPSAYLRVRFKVNTTNTTWREQYTEIGRKAKTILKNLERILTDNNFEFHGINQKQTWHEREVSLRISFPVTDKRSQTRESSKRQTSINVKRLVREGLLRLSEETFNVPVVSSSLVYNGIVYKTLNTIEITLDEKPSLTDINVIAFMKKWNEYFSMARLSTVYITKSKMVFGYEVEQITK